MSPTQGWRRSTSSAVFRHPPGPWAPQHSAVFGEAAASKHVVHSCPVQTSNLPLLEAETQVGASQAGATNQHQVNHGLEYQLKLLWPCETHLYGSTARLALKMALKPAEVHLLCSREQTLAVVEYPQLKPGCGPRAE